ncbi:MAG: c-type cytochrome [Usitatibacter sp.]
MKAVVIAGIVAALAIDARAADATHGKQLYEQCAACHSLEAGKQGLGPSLAGVVGRKSGALEDFRYSPAMKRANLAWTRETIGAFIAEPQKEIRGNRMPYSGMPQAADREDLLEYLLQAAK